MGRRADSHNVAGSICMVGPFPPPMYGASRVNEVVRSRLLLQGADPIVINLSSPTLNRALYTRLLRLPKAIVGLGKCLLSILSGGTKNLYISTSGGYGQLYDMSFVLIGRLFCKKLFLHHHSYAYLSERSFITSILTRLAGTRATHVSLCRDMGNRLKSLYPAVRNEVVLSNAVFIDLSKSWGLQAKDKLSTLGFLCNISYEKGIMEFLDVVGRLEKTGVNTNAIIAGPFQDGGVEEAVQKRFSVLKTAKYVGPKYGEEKTMFFTSIDILLFPTKYVNEAEPLTIYEAMSHGVPVIAWERGCIGGIINHEAGLAVPHTKDFVEKRGSANYRMA